MNDRIDVNIITIRISFLPLNAVCLAELAHLIMILVSFV